MRNRTLVAAACTSLALSLAACSGPAMNPMPGPSPADRLQQSPQFEVIQIEPGYRIEKVAENLTFLSGMTFDDQGRLYVAEAGGGFMPGPPPPRILRIENGRAVEVVNLQGRGVEAPVVGLTWHQGNFYISPRDPETMMGAVSRVTPQGQVTRILDGIRDAQAEHFLYDLRVGPDGMMYLGSGQATNSGVVGLDNAPFVQRNPGMRPVPCRDIVLTGVNYRTPDFRSDDPTATATTGAFVPFGTATQPGQRIEGDPRKCGGAILRFDPNNAEATVQAYAWGIRQPIGLAWNSRQEMFVTVNGTDIRGSRPINDEHDPTFRVREGRWYGHPDLSAALEPLNDARFDPPNITKVPRMHGGEMIPPMMPTQFVINHQASGLARPDRSLIAGLHEVNSSPSGADVAPAIFGFGDQLFVAEWGDLGPQTTPVRERPAGVQIVRIDPNT